MLAWAALVFLDEALEAAIAKTRELKQYAFVRTVERQGKAGSDSGAVDDAVLRLTTALGTLYRKGKVEVLHASGAAVKMEPLPEGVMPSPHDVFIELSRSLKDVTRSEEKGAKIFRGTVSEEVARKQIVLIGEFRQATLELRTDAAGRFVRAELSAVSRVGGRDLTYKSTQELSEVGKARIEIPPEVAKLLDP